MSAREECLCLHCMASIEEAELLFALFCEYEDEIEERCLIAAAPTLHLGEMVVRQQELEFLSHSRHEDV